MKRRRAVAHVRASYEHAIYLLAIDEGLCHPVHEPDPDDLTTSKRTWESLVQSWRKGIREGASICLVNVTPILRVTRIAIIEFQFAGVAGLRGAEQKRAEMKIQSGRVAAHACSPSACAISCARFATFDLPRRKATSRVGQNPRNDAAALALCEHYRARASARP